MKKILGIGASVVDTIITMDNYPIEDQKIKAEQVFITAGGPISNALVCSSKLGVKSGILGLFSDDQNGHFLIDEYKKFDVDVRGVKYIKNAHAFTSFIIINNSNSTRTCLFDRGTVQDDPSLIDFSIIDEYDILHLDGNYLNIAIEGAKYAKAHGKKVSLDAGSAYKDIDKLLPYVDILITSESFARDFTKIDDLNQAILILNEKYHPEILAITCGALGGLYILNNEIKNYNSFKINCIDSNGAGDIFHGAFLVAYSKGFDIEKSLEFASATSAIKCTKLGVRTALPTFEDVINFINERK